MLRRLLAFNGVQALTHLTTTLRAPFGADAILFIEVHLSIDGIYETLCRHSCLSCRVASVMAGLGAAGNEVAVDATIRQPKRVTDIQK